MPLYWEERSLAAYKNNTEPSHTSVMHNFTTTKAEDFINLYFTAYDAGKIQTMVIYSYQRLANIEIKSSSLLMMICLLG